VHCFFYYVIYKVHDVFDTDRWKQTEEYAMLCYNLSLQYKSLLKVEIKDDDKDKNKESLEDKM